MATNRNIESYPFTEKVQRGQLWGTAGRVPKGGRENNSFLLFRRCLGALLLVHHRLEPEGAALMA